MQRLIALDVIEEIKEGNYKRYRIIGNHERWVNMLAFMKNYYPSLWNKWSSRITEFFQNPDCCSGVRCNKIEVVVLVGASA